MSIAILLTQTLFSLSALEVGKMEMQDKKLVMEEGVQIKQEAGAFQANRGEAILDDDWMPLSLDFQGNVTFTMDDGAMLKSPFLSVDCKQREAFCHGTDELKVEYKNPKEGATLICKRMELHFKAEKPYLKKILAEEELEIRLENGERLFGTQAIMERGLNGISTVNFQGRTFIQTPTNDEIIAESAKLNLKGQTARLEGKTILKLSGEWKRTITSYGPVVIENDKILIESPSEEGVVPEELQISLQDERGEVFADRAELSYSRESGKLIMKNLVLSGNVRLIYNSQVALADQGVLDFPSKELRLKALSRNSVLFYDRLNRMQAGAREMIIRLNPATGEPSVKGVGVMRLTLKEDEFQELKNRFSSHAL